MNVVAEAYTFKHNSGTHLSTHIRVYAYNSHSHTASRVYSPARWYIVLLGQQTLSCKVRNICRFASPFSFTILKLSAPCLFHAFAIANHDDKYLRRVFAPGWTHRNSCLTPNLGEVTSSGRRGRGGYGGVASRRGGLVKRTSKTFAKFVMKRKNNFLFFFFTFLFSPCHLFSFSLFSLDTRKNFQEGIAKLWPIHVLRLLLFPPLTTFLYVCFVLYYNVIFSLVFFA